MICHHVLTDFELKGLHSSVLHTANFHSLKSGETDKIHLKLNLIKIADHVKWYLYMLQ